MEAFTWANLFVAGGPTLLVLIVCALALFVVIVERLIYYRGAEESTRQLWQSRSEQMAGEPGNIARDLAGIDSPMSYIFIECLRVEQESGRFDDAIFEEVKSRAIAEKIPSLERYLVIPATLGTVSPFIGLFGTVLGIIRAFMGIGAPDAVVAAGGLSALNAGIAEALIATAAGLFVAIPATVAYNYFRKRVDSILLELEIGASRLKIARMHAAARSSQG